MTANDDNTASDGDQAATVAAWNKVGVAMETMQTIWSRLAKNNFDLWKDIASSMQTGPLTAEKLAGNTARAMSTALDAATDLWLSFVEPTQRQLYAQVLPTALIFIQAVPDENGIHHFASQDPIHIPVPREREDLPPKAGLTINGSPGNGNVDVVAALDAIRAHLSITLEPGVRSYLLETIQLDQPPALVAGSYDGLIYLPGAVTLPLANLHVVIEAPDPDGSKL